MPQSSDGITKEPSRKSSVNLLTAWRNLTSSKAKSHGEAIPAAVTSTPVPFIKPGPHRSAASARIKKKSEEKRAGVTRTNTDQSAQSQLASSAEEHETFIGGPPELQALVKSLHASNPLEDRIQAARRIGKILHKYDINSVAGLIQFAQELITSSENVARQAGFQLLLSCARISTLNLRERLQLFDCASSHAAGPDFPICFEVIEVITHDGKDIEAIAHDLIPFLVTTLRERFVLLTEVRRRNRRDPDDASSYQEESFANLFTYIVNTIRFSSSFVNVTDLSRLLDETNEICKSTTEVTDFENAFAFINAMITFTNMPPPFIRPCLNLLGDVARQLTALRVQAWDTLEKLFRSHLGQYAIVELAEVLFEVTSEQDYSSNAVRGAFYVLRYLVEVEGKEGLPHVALSTVLLGINHVVENSDDKKFFGDVLRFFADLVSKDSLTHQLLDEADWTVLVETIVRCVNTFLPSHIPTTIIDGVVDIESAQHSQQGKPTETDTISYLRKFQALTARFCALLPQTDYLQREAIIDLFLRLPRLLDDDVAEILVSHCIEERTINPSNDRWMQVNATLVTTYLDDQRRSSSLRIKLAEGLRSVCAEAQLLPPDVTKSFVHLVLVNMSEERDTAVLDALAVFAVTAVRTCEATLFEDIFRMFHSTIFGRRDRHDSRMPARAASPIQSHHPDEPSLCRIATKHVIRMFIAHVNDSAFKAEALFELILSIASSQDCAVDARICAIKLLFRLRSDSQYAIWIRPLSESESLAAVLCRTAETAVPEFAHDELPPLNRVISSTNLHGSARRQFNVKTPVPPLWFYPGPKGLPEEPPAEASTYMFSYLAHGESHDLDRRALKINRWLETILMLIQQPGVNWEIYSYVLVHLGAQLANHNLFKDAIPQIKLLRSIICDQIKASSFHEPPAHTLLKKADVAICLFHTLTVVVSYKAHFADSEQDEIIRSFTSGIGSYEGTSKWCIHALSVCCHELPRATSKSLQPALTKMIQVITQSGLAIHILEFLTSLSRQPEAFRDLHESELKQVFAVCFRYLDYVRDQRSKGSMSQPSSLPSSRAGRNSLTNRDSFRDLRQNGDFHDRRPKQPATNEELPQYVYALAYHVITYWFMALRLEERPVFRDFVIRGLTYVDKDGTEHVEEQALVTMDMMDRVAFSDRDETAYKDNFAGPADGEVIRRNYLLGLSILTVETAGRTGLTQITRRRPSSTKYIIHMPSLTAPPKHQVPINHGVQADAFHTSSYVGVLPEGIVQEMFSSLSLAVAPRRLNEVPVILPDDESVNRALSVFDRNSTVDGHKVGVIYIGPQQTTEQEALANTSGSPDYTRFIQNLGTLVRLKGATFNTQGLDREDDMDGKFTYAWRDRATELVFHIITMMPTRLDTDPQSTFKKRHIGNDFVNIVWNNSGHPFRFDMFPSQFDYVYVVITPETQPSFNEIRAHPDDCFYKVQVQSKAEFPEISPAAETKLLSASALPGFVRLIALNASVFTSVWQHREGGEHLSPWRNRLREIRRLRDKYIGTASSPSSTEAPTSPVSTAQRPTANMTSFGSSSNLNSLLGAARQIATPSPSMLSSAVAPPPHLSSLHMASTGSVPTLSSRATAGDHYGGIIMKERTNAQVQQRSSLATFHSVSEMSSAATGSRSSFSVSEADPGEDGNGA